MHFLLASFPILRRVGTVPVLPILRHPCAFAIFVLAPTLSLCCRFAVNGTTGDSMSLSTEERKALAVSWVAAGTKYGVNIINHIGASSIEDTRILSAHAEEVGCDAVSCMPPFFFKTNSPRVVAEWLKEASDAAPTLPLYYYHFNVITGCYVDPLELIKACEETGVHTFRGFKFTDFNLW